MKCMKTAAALLLAVTLLAAALPVAAAGAVLTVDSVTAAPGETVTVTVGAKGLVDIVGIDLHIEYDSTRLECVAAEATGLAAKMSMASVNTTVSSAPDQIWLTAMSLNAVNGDGELLAITFRVKETAAEGTAAVTIIEKKDQLADSAFAYVTPTYVNGGVTVAGEAVAQTSAPSAQTTAVQTQTGEVPTTTASVPDTATTAPLTVMTKPDGGELKLPEPEQATDIEGKPMVDTNGEPLYVQGVAVTVSNATAARGETVEVEVAISAATDLTAVVLQIGYDTEALEYVGGETRGVLQTMAWSTVTEAEGIVSIGATDVAGVDGEGVVATLRFRVKDKAATTEHRLSLKTACEMQAGNVQVPLYLYAGEITVSGGESNRTTVIVAAVLAVLAVAVAVTAIAARKKKSQTDNK